MKKKPSRKPSKETPKAKAIIKEIGKLSQEERGKFDKLMAHELFFDASLNPQREDSIN